MDKEYQSLKVTISPLGPKRYRSRADDFPRGGSVGAGQDFDLDLEDYQPFLHAFRRRSVSPPSELGKFGADLFNKVFTRTVRDRYVAAGDIAARERRALRICLSVQAPDLVALPWELLHDDSGFLIHDRGYAIVRVIDELQGTKSSFGHVQHVLIAAANPAAGYDPFDADAHLAALTATLEKTHKTVEQLYPASKKSLRRALEDQRVEAFYFVGHGLYTSSGGKLVCQRDNDGAAEELEAGTLAGWLQEAKNIRIVYLNACSTAKTGIDAPFYGVAQRLMLDGNVASVLAMPIDIPQSDALPMAETFFAELTTVSPEEAIQKARRNSDGEADWAIPVLYSYLDAPAQFDTNRLSAFLGLSHDDRCELVIPSFVMGTPTREAPLKIDTQERFVFPGETYAKDDMDAALSVRDLVARVVPVDAITIVPQHQWHWAGRTSLFLFGSKSNPSVSSVLKEFSTRFTFKYEPTQWTLIDREKTEQPYTITAPHRLTWEAYEQIEDYGVIQKLHKAGEPTKFVIAGLGSRATRGCGQYLMNNWQKLLAEFGQDPFAIVLRFPAGLDTAGFRE